MNTDEKVSSAAATWLMRLEAGCSDAQQDDFLQWLTASPAHAEAFNRLQSLWTRLDILTDRLPSNAANPDRDLLLPKETPASQSPDS